MKKGHLMKHGINWKGNFPWTFFGTGVILLVLSLLFKAYDMAVVACIPIVGSFGLLIYGCYLDKQD